MSLLPDVLWLNVSPRLQRFDRPLLHVLSQHSVIALWEYSQSPDEPNSFEQAIALLHDYLKPCDRPLHLIGHSTSGLLGLLYARQYPERVKSLTLLSVGGYPAVDWQAHFYAQAQCLPCSRHVLLSQLVYRLFGRRSHAVAESLIHMLEQDLITALSPHTLFRRASLPPGGVPVPLLVCRGETDFIVDPTLFQAWQEWLKAGDRLWSCPQGGHFFHYDYPERVGQQIWAFWSSLQPTTLIALSPFLRLGL